MTRNKGSDVALWAGGAAFCGSVLAVGAFDILNVQGWAEFLSSIVVGFFTGGAIYCRERLNFAQRRKNNGGEP